MFRRPLQPFRARRWRRWLPGRGGVSVLMMVSLVVAYVGYPSWKLPAGKRGEPFPCQFSQCGCRTAEQCRTSCCCHTKQEKFAWAIERGIDPDRVAVLTEQEKSQFARQQLAETSPPKSCCAAKGHTAHAAHAHSSSCCDAEADGGLTFVLAISAQKCRAAGLDWIEAGFVAAPPPVVTFAIALRQVPAVERIDLSYAPPVAGQLLRPV